MHINGKNDDCQEETLEKWGVYNRYRNLVLPGVVFHISGAQRHMLVLPAIRRLRQDCEF